MAGKNPFERTFGEDREEPEERTGKNPWRGQDRTEGKNWKKSLAGKNHWGGLERTLGEDGKELPERTRGWKEPLGRTGNKSRKELNRTLGECRE